MPHCCQCHGDHMDLNLQDQTPILLPHPMFQQITDGVVQNIALVLELGSCRIDWSAHRIFPVFTTRVRYPELPLLVLLLQR